ncbi:hypothetical protein ACOSQ4_032000 [Xanthoceras sorbifolium]
MKFLTLTGKIVLPCTYTGHQPHTSQESQNKVVKLETYRRRIGRERKLLLLSTVCILIIKTSFRAWNLY